MIYNLNRRIDENQWAILVFGDINDDKLFMNIDLSCRKSDARCGIHGLKHIVDGFSQSISDFCDRGCFLAQPQVREFENF